MRSRCHANKGPLSLAVLDLAIRAYISAKNPDAALWVAGSKSIKAVSNLG